MYEDNTNPIIYTEDDIVELTNHLKNLKGKILMDNNGDFFTLKSYDIQGVDHLEWNGFFRPKKKTRMFLIHNIVLAGDDGDHIYEDDQMCSAHGVKSLMQYHLNYTALQSKLIKFTTKHDLHLNFGFK